MNEKVRTKRRVPFFVVIGLLLLGFIVGVTEYIAADSWVNGSGYIYPNGSWSSNVNVTGNFSVDGNARIVDGAGYGYWSNGSTTYIGYVGDLI